MIKQLTLTAIIILLFGVVLLSGCTKNTTKMNDNGSIEIINMLTNNLEEPTNELKNCAEEDEQFSKV